MVGEVVGLEVDVLVVVVTIKHKSNANEMSV